VQEQVQVQARVQAQLQVQSPTKTSDNGRVWLWSFLAVIALSQLYIVKELLAAFALFALLFAALASVVAVIYMVQKSWELAIARLGAVRRPLLTMPSVGNIAGVSAENRKAA
jgi:hypothetical protein